MNVLSLFDGMSCGQLALNKAGIKYDKYIASEVDDHAIKVTQNSFPNTLQLGDVTKLDKKSLSELPKINLLIGGSPCQDFSTLKFEREGLRGEKSKLFYEYLRILQYVKERNNPKVKFLLENVRMKKESKDELDAFLGVSGELINSNQVVPQNRPRFYWTNINYGKSVDNATRLRIDDLLQPADTVAGKYYCKQHQLTHYEKCKHVGEMQTGVEVVDFYNKSIKYGKANCITPHASRCDRSATNIVKQGGRLRRLTPLECERLQTVPDEYTRGVSDTQRYRMLGNGWTVDVIAHILSGIKEAD